MECILFYPNYKKTMAVTEVAEVVSYCILLGGRYFDADKR